MSIQTLLLIYVLGGLTFIPLLLIAFFAFAYFTLPRVAPQPTSQPHETQALTKADDTAEDAGFADKEEIQGTSGTDAAGYFAVCREYVPGGVNGKPPERSSPAGEVLSAESPSVYQSMYRSIFERNKTPSYSLEGDKKDPKAVKRPRNVFFVVLRHEHLLLFDNADQLEVRHVISLLHHNVDVYGGEGPLLEDDMWIKKNCIRLSRKPTPGNVGPTSEPFYIFSDNCSDKEDFYHAMIAAQAKNREGDAPPHPRTFAMDHIIKLVQALHTSDADPHARWFNALLGRLFLAMYGTEEAENGLKAKIDRKVSQAPKPNFIVSIQVQKVELGHAAPIFSNFKLKELMVDGSLTIETDVKYSGGLRLQIAALARIDLGSRIRAREVDLVLAGLVKKLSGHLLIRIKPPPSNRFWISFETMPQLDLSVEPVVSSMQITYGVILRAIESKIREVIGETLVYPNWDDIPFFDTRRHAFRGGIWDLPKGKGTEMPVHENESATGPNTSDMGEIPKVQSSPEKAEGASLMSGKNLSMPSLLSSPGKDVKSRKPARKPVTPPEADSASTAVSTSSTPAATPTRSRPTSPRVTPADKPRVMRVNSFAAMPTTSVSTDDVVQHTNTRKSKGHRDAVDVVKEVKSRSDSMSAQQRPAAEDDSKIIQDDDDALEAESPLDSISESASLAAAGEYDTASLSSSAPKQLGGIKHSSTLPVSINDAQGRKRTSWGFAGSPHQAGSAIERAATSARTWGINMINRQREAAARKSASSGFTSLAKEAGLEGQQESALPAGAEQSADVQSGGVNEAIAHVSDGKDKSASSRQPMGRGQPIPQAAAAAASTEAQPKNSSAAMTAALKAAGAAAPSSIPQQKQSLWATSALNVGSLKRKPVSAQTAETPSAPASQPSTVDKDTAAADLKRELMTQHHRRTSSISGVFDMSDSGTTPPRNGSIDQARSRNSSLTTIPQVTRTSSDPENRKRSRASSTDAVHALQTDTDRSRQDEAVHEDQPVESGGATKQNEAVAPLTGSSKGVEVRSSPDDELLPEQSMHEHKSKKNSSAEESITQSVESASALPAASLAAKSASATTPPAEAARPITSPLNVNKEDIVTPPTNDKGKTAGSAKEKGSLLSLGGLNWGINNNNTSGSGDGGSKTGGKVEGKSSSSAGGEKGGKKAAPAAMGGVGRRASEVKGEKTKRD